MSKKVTMLVNAASPSRVLRAGKTYVLPDDEADAIVKAGSGKDEVSAAGKLADRRAKAVKPQSPPDPGEVKGVDDLDDEADDGDE